MLWRLILSSRDRRRTDFWRLLIRLANNCSPFSSDVAVIGHPDLGASFTKPVISNLLTSLLTTLSRKHGLATFVHERLRYTLLDQSPPTSEMEWLCVDVDGYKIVNVYKPPPTRLRTLDLPVFPHPCLYAGDFNCRHADWGYDDNSPDVSAWLAGKVLIVLPSYIMPRTPPVFIPAAATLAPIQI